MPFGDRNFDFGVNMAWLNGANGHDLGRNPYFLRWSICWSQDLVRAYFRDISARGFKVVRIWAFEKLEGLQFDSSHFDPAQIVSQENRDGRTIIRENTSNYERWNIPRVTGLQTEFQDNVRALMRIAQEAELEIYWTILSGGNYFKKPMGHHQWALKKMLETPGYRSAFIDNALRPFLGILSQFRQNIYAIDLINEPEGFFYWPILLPVGILTPSRSSPRRLNYPLDTIGNFVLEYITETSDMIRRDFREFKVSVGFRKRDAIVDNLSALDPKIDFYDFHHYDTDELELDPVSEDGKPTILGEIGYMSNFGRFNPDGTEQSEAIDGIIGDAILRGFKGCLLWMYTPHSAGNDSNNLLIARSGYNKCALRTTQAFINSFNSNPDHFWRPVINVINDRREEIDRLNSTR